MSWLDALGWLGSALLVFSVMQARVLRFRVLNLLACLVLIAFNAALEIWPMVAMNVALAAINVYFLRRLLTDRHDENAFEVLEVAPDDRFLHHVLEIEAASIRKYQPVLIWDASSPASRSFLILRGHETVGVVLVTDTGDGTAQIALDYVTPRFRDFSPGEFVWRRSHLLQDHGFSRVVTPPGMVNPYYERIGFIRQGDSFVLTLPIEGPR